MSSRLPLLRENRDDVNRVIRVVNDLWRRIPAGGLVYFPAIENISAFYCVGADEESEGVVVARADGGADGPFAIGVAMQQTLVGATVPIRTKGRINGAVSGRAANDPIWVGNDGSLVFAAPAGPSYFQPIGVCINATDIYVNPEVPVF